MNYIELIDWFPYYVGKTSQCSVEGTLYKDLSKIKKKRENNRWTTSIITKRICQNQLSTNSGSLYILKGVMNVKSALEKGFPSSLTNLFINGFPEEWKELLVKHRDENSSYKVLTTNQTKKKEYRKRKKQNRLDKTYSLKKLPIKNTLEENVLNTIYIPTKKESEIFYEDRIEDCHKKNEANENEIKIQNLQPKLDNFEPTLELLSIPQTTKVKGNNDISKVESNRTLKRISKYSK